MSNDYPKKSPPGSIAIFGAGGRMASHVVDYLRYKAPDIRLRLLASSEAGLASLVERYPDEESMLGNYFDPASLDAALDSMEGVFVVTASGMDEKVGMDNFVAAAKKAGAARHIIRLVGYAPESNPDKLPACAAPCRPCGWRMRGRIRAAVSGRMCRSAAWSRAAR